jgi:hypothetical protein
VFMQLEAISARRSHGTALADQLLARSEVLISTQSQRNASFRRAPSTMGADGAWGRERAAFASERVRRCYRPDLCWG